MSFPWGYNILLTGMGTHLVVTLNHPSPSLDLLEEMLGKVTCIFFQMVVKDGDLPWDGSLKISTVNNKSEPGRHRNKTYLKP